MTGFESDDWHYFIEHGITLSSSSDSVMGLELKAGSRAAVIPACK